MAALMWQERKITEKETSQVVNAKNSSQNRGGKAHKAAPNRGCRSPVTTVYFQSPSR